MKNFPNQITLLALVVLFFLSIKLTAQEFQRVYGDALDNYFGKVIQDGSGNFYVLGQNEAVNGAPLRATVTRLDANGQHQWTLSLNFASQWQDAVLTPSGELMAVGHTLPLDATSKGIMARVTSAGAFARLRTYDEAGRDILTRIVRKSGAFPYYVIGAQYDGGASPTFEDVVLFNMDQDLNINFKKRYYRPGDDEYFRDFESLGANTLAMAGNWANGLIFISDNGGNISAGVQLPNRFVRDIHRELFGGVYAASTNGGNSEAYIEKFDASLFMLWEYRINGLTSISQVWEGLPGSGELYAVGVGNFGNQQRTVVVKLVETINDLTVAWVKYLTVGNGYTGGSAWFLNSVKLAFTDARTIPGGFGQNCAFVSVSGLEMETCEVGTSTTTLTQTDPFPNSPDPLPLVETAPITTGVNSVEASAINWQQQVACSVDPCSVDIVVTPMSPPCGQVQVCAVPTGTGPYSYQWCNGSTSQCYITQINPCTPTEFCVSVTCADGTVASDTEIYTFTDNTPPVALCSGIGVDLDPVLCTATITPGLIDGGSSDNCGIASMSVSPSVVTGCGLHPVTLTVTDHCGNMSSCSTQVQTIEVVPPAMTCPPNIAKKCDDKLTPADCGTATAVDNCDPNPVISYTDVVNGIMPCDGNIQRTWTAEDNCGNVVSCVQTIVVVDNVPPSLTNCPQNQTVTGIIGPNGQCTANVQVTSPTVSDNCDQNVTLTNSFNGTANASGVYPQGTTTVVWTAQDQCNEVTCSFTVTVQCEPPVSDKCGWTVATCYSDNPADPVGVIYDTRYNASAAAGADWGTTLNPGAIHPPDWKGSIIGSVFGIALDDVNEKIFLSASDVYKLDASYLNTYTGPGGRAGIYKTDCAPPYPTANIVTTLNSPTIPSISGTMLPNTGGVGNGIGNICYDKLHGQLFASNLEDGRIYRIDPNGNILSAYDPFATDTGLNGMPSSVSERIWGVGFNRTQNRLYFTVQGANATQKYVYSVGLTGTGEFIATNVGGNLYTDALPQPEIVTGLPGSQLKFTDIAFSQNGDKMLLAERGNPHSAGVFEYNLVGTTWVASPNNYYVGGFSGENSAGGVDYGYKEQGGKPTAICDGLVWATGNYMMATNNFTLVYGLEGISAATGNSFPANQFSDIYIDYDGVYSSAAKNEIGDVELFKCGCPGQASVCDSISVTSMPFNSMAQDTCCFKLTVDNQKPNFFTAIQLCTSGGVSFSNVSALNGCVLNSYSAGQVTVVPPGGIPNPWPVGTKDFVKFCLSNYQNVPSQQVIVKYYGPDFEVVCTDTLTYNCTQKPKCLKLTPEVTCGPNGTYKMDFCVMADAFIPFTVGSFVLNPPPSSGITFTPNVFVPSPPLTPGSMQCGFSTTISGAVDGQTFCFSVTAHQQNIANGEPLLNCCTDTVMLVCVTMPDCVCDKVFADTMSVPSPDGDCCWKINLTNNYQTNYFTGVQLEICTPGVVFGAINNPGFVWNLNSGPTLATFKPIPGPFIGATATLPTFCLSGITGPTQVPQMVVLKWLGPNMQVVCTDTMLFDCPWPDTTDCAVLVCPQVECDPDVFGIYNFSFQVQNNSGFTINQVNLNNVTGCGLFTNTQFSITPLPNGNISGSLSTQIVGCSAGQQICFNLTVHELGPNGNELNCCTHSKQICITLPTCGFCPGNLIQNGDFEIGVASANDEDIFLAQYWSGIWPDGNNPISTADFWNTGTFNNTIINTIPLPLSQSGYAAFWAKLHTNQVWREGIMNDLFSDIAPNTGSYDFEMKVACLSPVLPGPNSVLPSVSVYGVDMNSTSTGAPGGLAPTNTGLFINPAPVLLGTITLPSTCDLNFQPYGFSFNSNILPAGFQMNRIFITRTDGVGSDVYLAVDDVSLKTADTCCVCGPFDLLYSVGHGPLLPKNCGDTLYVPTGVPFAFLPSFHCLGSACPSDSAVVDYDITGPNNFHDFGSVIASPGFSVPISPSTFQNDGTYCLTMTGHCGDHLCPCKIYFVYPSPCCTSYEDFCNRVENNVSISVDNDLCKATLNIGDIGCDDYIEWVDWGPQTVQGPFPPGTMPMFTYPGSGTYTVCYLAIERDSQGQICYEKVVCDTITVDCKNCCTSYDEFCALVAQGFTVVKDPAQCKVTVTAPQFDSCHWFSTPPYIPGNPPLQVITDPSGMWMFNFNQSGTYQICVKVFEQNADTMCWMKEMCTTFDLACADSCECLGFQEMNFLVNGEFLFVNCNNQPPLPLPCPDSTGNYFFHGDLLCSDSCATGVGWEFFDSNNTSLWSGTAPVNWSGGNLFHFDLPNIPYSIFNGPGNFQLVLNGYCGSDTCECVINFTVPPCDSLCPDNLVKNGMLEQGTPDGTDESISLANGWGPIWASPPALSTGDFYNTSTAPSPFGVPLPATQGNYAAFWCRLQGTQAVWREGVMNQLGNPILPNTGCYDLTFKLACLFNNPGPNFPGLSVFGVSTTGFGTGNISGTDGMVPLNSGIFPAGTSVELYIHSIPAACDANFQTITFNFNSSILPPGGITHIFFTRTDGMPGTEFVALDDVCLVPAPCLDTCCTNFDAFCQAVENATTITFGPAPCKVTLNIGDLPCDDYIEWVNWGDGTQSGGPFTSGAMPMHTYNGSGTYAITYLAIEKDPATGQICFEKVLNDTVVVDCPSCTCGSFTNLVIKNKKTGLSQPLTCNNQPPQFIPCPPSGKPHHLTGKLVCNGNCTATNISWTVMNPAGSNVVTGSAVGPWFNITIPSTAVTMNGLYMVKIQGMCGTQVCECKINLNFDGCGPDCKCDPLGAFQAEVNKGFHLTSASSCTNNFIANGSLTECDQITWKVKNSAGVVVGTGTVAANTPWTFTYPGAGLYNICMKVVRTEPNGTVCMHEKCLAFNIICIPIGICTEPILENHSFSIGALPGILGQGGASSGWERRSGEPTVLTNTPGSDDLVAVQLIGNCIKWDIMDHKISLTQYEPCKYRLRINQSGVAGGGGVQPGGVLVGRLSTEPQGTGTCTAECEEIFRVPIEGSPDGWFEAQGAFTPNFGGELFLTLHLENDFVEDDPATQSALMVDFLCVELLPANAAGEKSTDNSIRLYPNPTSSGLTLEFKGAVPLAGEVQILDLFGRSLHRQVLLAGQSQHQLSVAALPAGVYFVKVSEDGVPVWVEKIIKQ